MSKETPKDDSRERSERSFKQTDKPWAGNPENEQRSHVEKDDLERWQESNTN